MIVNPIIVENFASHFNCATVSRFSDEMTSPSSVCYLHITKTCLGLYNFDPLKPHFYIIKLGFTGVYVTRIFLISAQKRTLWVLVRTDAAAVLTSIHNLCSEQKYKKYQIYLSENFQFLEVKFSICLNRRVFKMRKSALDYQYLWSSPACPYKMRPVKILIRLRLYQKHMQSVLLKNFKKIGINVR